MLALPSPAYKPNGIEMTKAQGQETTRNVRARYNQSLKTASSKINIGTIANNTAKATTVGVYIRANLVINLSIGAFLLAAFSINSKIFETVESTYGFVTLISRMFVKLTTPAKTSSFSRTSLGIDSPVKLDVSKEEIPFTTTPSNGIFSPTFTTIISSTLTSSGSTFLTPVDVFRLANSLLISINEEIELLVLLTA